jgi:transcriptional regulator with XRE-family HTH domain
MRVLGEAFKAVFEKVLKKNGLTQTDAARLLGVSRQTLHSYLKGHSVPRDAHLIRAAELWSDFRIEAGGQVYDKDSLSSSSSNSPASVPKQLNLFVLKGLKHEDLQISVKQVENDVQIEVNFKIPA